MLRVLTLNTHRGQGPNLRYVLEGRPEETRRRLKLLHDTRAYTYHIADWLSRHRDSYAVVALQEVFYGVLGRVQRIWTGSAPQHEYYRTISGYPNSWLHRVGHAAFRYENVLLSHLPPAGAGAVHALLPGRVFRLAACGFTLVPVEWEGRTVWIGNTHLHAYDPFARRRQAVRIARAVRGLGDVPVLLLGDLNTVPPGCRDADFPHGGRERRSYKGDRTLAILRKAGLRGVPHEDGPRFWTHPTGLPNRTLDYVLSSRHWKVDDYRVLDEFTLSDHYPVEAAFRLT